MTRTPEQILCCPGGCDHEGNACSAHNRAWTEGDGSAMLYRYISMSPADRLTLARALVPDGWVVAQRIATKEQILAGIGALNEGRAYRNEPPLHAQHNVADVAAIFDAMLAAAQEETT